MGGGLRGRRWGGGSSAHSGAAFRRPPLPQPVPAAAPPPSPTPRSRALHSDRALSAASNATRAASNSSTSARGRGQDGAAGSGALERWRWLSGDGVEGWEDGEWGVGVRRWAPHSKPAACPCACCLAAAASTKPYASKPRPARLTTYWRCVCGGGGGGGGGMRGCRVGMPSGGVRRPPHALRPSVAHPTRSAL